MQAELKEKYVPTLVAGWKLWPAAHVINFAFVPNHHRILYTNVVSVAGTYILSKAASGDLAGRKSLPTTPAKKKQEETEYPVEVLFDGVNVKLD